jgi:Protein of unknown function (DUF1549)/Planctomycete cytochrome C
MSRVGWNTLAVLLLWSVTGRGSDITDEHTLERQIMPLLKARCVKCHGPAVREGRLNLATPRGLARGGESGPAVVPRDTVESVIWEKISGDEMPPKEPLPASEKAMIERWIAQGAPGLPVINSEEPEGADHWAFAGAKRPEIPPVRDRSRVRTPVDRFIQAALERHGLSLGPDADRAALIRRVGLDLTGLPPTPTEIARFENDRAPDAYERMIDRFFASPHYGERWGKYWLDAAGYSDSNGYFSADTDRPLAYRYRDYVIGSWNQDKSLLRFVQEQLAGDELVGFQPGGRITPEMKESLVATHFLRNAPDGTGESDGNPEEVRADRYAVLEGTTQILGSCLFGLTFQCARCHDHKFEPLTQRDYYQLYAVLWPAYDQARWVKPQDRAVDAPLPQELAAWEAQRAALAARSASVRRAYACWAEQNREHGSVVFRDDFENGSRLADRWSHSAPGDSDPAGRPPVKLDSDGKPGAQVRDGTLRIGESGDDGSRCLSTRTSFDWTPDAVGGWIQATFDLVDTRLDSQGQSAERIGYYIALHDYNDKHPHAPRGGNILIDGNPRAGAELHVDYPGSDSREQGRIGSSGYKPARRYGVRVTNIGQGRFSVEHVVDWVTEQSSAILSAAELPDGGFEMRRCAISTRSAPSVRAGSPGCRTCRAIPRIPTSSSAGSMPHRARWSRHRRRQFWPIWAMRSTHAPAGARARRDGGWLWRAG